MQYTLRSHCLLISIAVLLWTCAEPFAYSPFEADVRNEWKNTTEENLKAIADLDTVLNEPFAVALISDSHYHLKDLTEAIDDINKKNIYSFIIVTGDFTENGLLKEYEIFRQLMNRSNIPWLTVIGNHDHLSNGTQIYQQMFGPLNYVFSFRNTKFVVWDNTIWESKKEADYTWLQNVLTKETDDEGNPTTNHTVLLSHIPPFDYQLIDKSEVFNEILKNHGVAISIHGHKHEFFYADLYGDGMMYVTVGSPQKRNYAELRVNNNNVDVVKVNY